MLRELQYAISAKAEFGDDQEFGYGALEGVWMVNWVGN